MPSWRHWRKVAGTSSPVRKSCSLCVLSVQDVAEKIYERHCFFTHQLISVGVNPQVAEVDACRMEHAVSDESFQKLKEHAMREIASQKIDNTFDNFPVKK